MHAMPAELHKLADHELERDPLKRITDLHRLFADACRFVLGLPEVTFWSQSPSGEWALNQLGADTPVKLGQIRETVNTFADTTSTDIVDCGPSCLLGMLGGVRNNQRSVILISGLNHQVHVPRERIQLVRHMLGHFIKAHEHAVSVARTTSRRHFAHKYAESVDRLVRASAEGRTVEGMIQSLAQSWHGLVFGRVMVSLVNASETELQTIYEEKDAEYPALSAVYGSVNLTATNSHMILKEALKGVPVVCTHPERDERLSIPVREIGLGPFVVLPLMNSRRKATGTIVLERRDRSVPDASEVRELLFLVDQLALAIEATERASLLQFALDAIPEATLIVDQRLRTEYTSKPAADLFGIPSGWRAEDKRADDLANLPGLRSDAMRSMYGATVMRYDENLGKEKWAAETISIGMRNTRGQSVGSLLHFRNYTPLRRTVNALGSLAASESIQQAKAVVLDATKELDFKWGRLYSPLPDDPGTLVSESCFGLTDEQTAAVFSRRIRLPHRQTPSNASWLCIENKQPLLFRYLPDRSYGSVLQTKYNLDYITVHRVNAKEDIPKQVGDYWIDLPLLTTKEVIGKVTLGCDESLLPEEFRLLKQLADLYPLVFDSILSKERSTLARDERLQDEAARDTVNAAVHTLINVFAPLTNITYEYERHGDNAEIAELNLQLRARVATGLATINRVYRAFGRGQGEPKEECELLSLLRESATLREKEVACSVESQSATVRAIVDRHGIEAVLAELVQNTIDAAPEQSRPQIHIVVSLFERNRREYIRIAYADNGPGIPREFKRRAFKEFETHAHRGGRRRHGTGIGLTVVRRIVEDEHEGFVREVGEPGEGVQFIIEFPRISGGVKRDESNSGDGGPR